MTINLFNKEKNKMAKTKHIGKFGKIIIMVGLLSVFALSSVALAQSYGYNDTLPTFGHKTLVEGVKNVDDGYAVNQTGNCQSAFYCWIDYKYDNSWRVCTGDYECYANSTVQMKYDYATPGRGTSVRLRTKIYSANVTGGQRVIGNITF